MLVKYCVITITFNNSLLNKVLSIEIKPNKTTGLYGEVTEKEVQRIVDRVAKLYKKHENLTYASHTWEVVDSFSKLVQ